MDYVNLAMAAWNEVSASTWMQWLEPVLIALAGGLIAWTGRVLWERTDWLQYEQEVTRPVVDDLAERVGMLEMAVSHTRAQVSKHEAMLAHMAAMREAKAAKKAKQVA